MLDVIPGTRNKRNLKSFHFLCAIGMEGQFNKYKHSKVDSMDFDYDYSSLMHYGKRTFSKNGKPTIRALNNPYMSLGRSVGFSDLDIKKMNALYDCKSKCWSFVVWQPQGY